MPGNDGRISSQVREGGLPAIKAQISFAMFFVRTMAIETGRKNRSNLFIEVDLLLRGRRGERLGKGRGDKNRAGQRASTEEIQHRRGLLFAQQLAGRNPEVLGRSRPLRRNQLSRRARPGKASARVVHFPL